MCSIYTPCSGYVFPSGDRELIVKSITGQQCETLRLTCTRCVYVYMYIHCMHVCMGLFFMTESCGNFLVCHSLHSLATPKDSWPKMEKLGIHVPLLLLCIYMCACTCIYNVHVCVPTLHDCVYVHVQGWQCNRVKSENGASISISSTLPPTKRYS